MSRYLVTMPQLGESVTEGTISRWLVNPGDRVAEFDAMVEINTDKVDAEVPAPVTGVLTEILAAEGAVVPVGADIAVLEVNGAAGGTRRGDHRSPGDPGGSSGTAAGGCSIRCGRSFLGARGGRAAARRANSSPSAGSVGSGDRCRAPAVTRRRRSHSLRLRRVAASRSAWRCRKRPSRMRGRCRKSI